jgi:predicted transcriptional regulator
MSEDDIRLENHRLIYDYIDRNPGTHLRRISRDLDIHLSTLRYHLGYLEESDLIVKRDEKNLKVYFAAGKLSPAGRKLAPYLRQKRFRDIILDIMANPDTTHAGIAERLSLRPSTLSKYLNVLKERDLVAQRRSGRERHFKVVDEREVIELLILYKRSFWDKFVDNALDIYFER